MPRSAWKEEPLAELMRLARAGESWQMIGSVFFPRSLPHRAIKASREAFARHADCADREARRWALRAHNFNKPPGLSRRAARRHRRRARVESAVSRERVDPFAGLGGCFA
jgi:hypothetical protein